MLKLYSFSFFFLFFFLSLQSPTYSDNALVGKELGAYNSSDLKKNYYSDNALLKKGLEAFKRGDLKTAYDCFYADANKNNPLSQTFLGQMYHEGKGVKQNYFEAAKWFEKASSKGVAIAEYNLARMYLAGSGVQQNLPKAIALLKRAGDQKFSDAECLLGMVYYTSRKYNLAAMWMIRAANNGNKQAQHNLGTMYYDGEGVPKDFVKAYLYFSLADSQEAICSLSLKMSNAEIVRAKKLFQSWEQK